MSDQPPKMEKNKKILLKAILFFAVIGIAYFFNYWFYARFYEYTDDAYVSGNLVFVTPQVEGAIISINTDDTDFVVKGRPLIELDKTDFEIRLEKMTAELGNAVRDVVALFERVEELEAEIMKKKARFVQCAQDFEHRKELIEEGAVSTEDLEHAIAYLEESFADLISTEHAYVSSVAQVENTTVETHPKVEYAKGCFRQAYVDLKRCSILAPVTGIIAQRRVQVGQQVNISEPLLAIIPMDQMWIDANFKEVQLSDMRIGQPVKIRSDLWGSGVLFQGTVIGIGAGTGSVFSVLPPQNATGNWIKIVQRIPVRIGLKPEEILRHPLRLGMSVEATVDIHNTELKEIPPERPLGPIYETEVISHQEEGVEERINEIIRSNLSLTFLDSQKEPSPFEEME